MEGDGRSGESATASDGGEGFRTRRPPTAACGGTPPTSGEVGFAGGRPNAAGGECGEAPASADPSAACGGISPTSGEGLTNEPEVNEDVIYSQTQEIVELTADSGVDSGLDNVAEMLGAGGRRSAAEIGDPESHEASLLADAATADCGETFRTRGPASSPPHRRLRRHLPHEWGGKLYERT